MKGQLATGESVDGSLGITNPATSAAYVDEEGYLVAVYQPDTSILITPVVQVSVPGDSSVTVFIDRFEAYVLDDEFEYQAQLFSIYE